MTASCPLLKLNVMNWKCNSACKHQQSNFHTKEIVGCQWHHNYAADILLCKLKFLSVAFNLGASYKLFPKGTLYWRMKSSWLKKNIIKSGLMLGSHTKKEVVSGIIIHCSKTVHIDLATEIKRYQTFLGESSVCTDCKG